MQLSVIMNNCYLNIYFNKLYGYVTSFYSSCNFKFNLFFKLEIRFNKLNFNAKKCKVNLILYLTE